MYNELYEVWQQELENVELVRLPDDFYLKVAEYLKRIREESRMLDKRTVKANLLRREWQNVKCMFRGFIRKRYKKLIGKVARGEKIPVDALTIEEKKIFSDVSSFAEAYRTFAKNLIQGHFLKIKVEKEPKIVVLRFLKDVPALIGSDLKTYGPFKAEDIASLPPENAKILVKQGLAEKVEVMHS
jgi:DNA replication factor GINS